MTVAAVLLALGAVIVAVGVALFSVPAGVIVFGAAVFAAGWDLASSAGQPRDERYRAAVEAGFLSPAEVRRLEGVDGDGGEVAA